MFANIIFHIDVNSAFLSWEATYRLHHKGGKIDLREQVAAIAGGLAGLYYGYEGIPKEWLKVIAYRERIEELCESYKEWKSIH